MGVSKSCFTPWNLSWHDGLFFFLTLFFHSFSLLLKSIKKRWRNVYESVQTAAYPCLIWLHQAVSALEMREDDWDSYFQGLGEVIWCHLSLSVIVLTWPKESNWSSQCPRVQWNHSKHTWCEHTLIEERGVNRFVIGVIKCLITDVWLNYAHNTSTRLNSKFLASQNRPPCALSTTLDRPGSNTFHQLWVFSCAKWVWTGVGT